MTLARDIYQANLDAVSRAIMTGDLYLLREHVAIPIMIYGPASEVVVTSIEQMEILIAEYRAELIAQGFTSYRRDCISAGLQPGMQDMIVGTHSTIIMAGRSHIVPPFNVQMALMRIDGSWKAIWQQMEATDTPIEFLAADITDAQKKAHRRLGLQASRRRKPTEQGNT